MPGIPEACPTSENCRHVAQEASSKQTLWEQETDRTLLWLYTGKKACLWTIPFWGQLRAFNMEPAKVLGAICDELKDVVAEVASKNGFAQCIAMF